MARKTLRARWDYRCAPCSATGSRPGRGFIESLEGRLSTNCFRVLGAKLRAQYFHSLIQLLGRARLPGSTQRLTEPLARLPNIPTRRCKAAENSDRGAQ